MKSSFIILILLAFFSAACSPEEEIQTYNVIFEANGVGEVDYIIHSNNCGMNFTNCFTEVISEKPSFPFKAEIKEYTSELISMKVIVSEESQKENISELKITVDKKVHILKKADFNWWDDGPYGMQLELGVSN